MMPSPPSRLSEKLRRAIEIRVTTGVTINEACAQAGISPQGYYKALARPAVREHYEAVQRQFVADSDQLRAGAKVLALAVAVKLMTETKDEKVKARMCEFLAGDGRTPTVQVSIDARQHLPASNYTFVRPASLDTPPIAIEGS